MSVLISKKPHSEAKKDLLRNEKTKTELDLLHHTICQLEKVTTKNSTTAYNQNMERCS